MWSSRRKVLANRQTTASHPQVWSSCLRSARSPDIYRVSEGCTHQDSSRRVRHEEAGYTFRAQFHLVNDLCQLFCVNHSMLLLRTSHHENTLHYITSHVTQSGMLRIPPPPAHLNGCPSSDFWMACRMPLYILKQMVTDSRARPM